MKVLCLGVSSFEFTFPADEFPKENSKYSVTDKVDGSAGMAPTISYLLATWGIETYISSIVGSDDYGNFIRKELESVGVKTEYLDTSFDKPTSMRVSIVNKSTGGKILYDTSESTARIRKEEWAISPDIVVASSKEYHAAMTAFNRFADKITVLVADEYNAETADLCKYAKYVIASKEVAEKISGKPVNLQSTTTLAGIFNILVEKYYRTNFVITLADGGALFAADGQIRVTTGINAKAIDTTSAKDIFAGAFVYSLAVNYDMPKCIQVANIAGGLSTEKIGSHDSIPPLNSVMTALTQKLGGSVAVSNDKPAENAQPAPAAQAPAQSAPAAPAQPAPAAQPAEQPQPAAPAAPTTPAPATTPAAPTASTNPPPVTTVQGNQPTINNTTTQ